MFERAERKLSFASVATRLRHDYLSSATRWKSRYRCNPHAGTGGNFADLQLQLTPLALSSRRRHSSWRSTASSTYVGLSDLYMVESIGYVGLFGDDEGASFKWQ